MARAKAKRASREILHRLVDEIPNRDLRTAQRFLTYLRDIRDPVLRAFVEAPEDDEPETEEECLAVAESKEQVRRGEVRPWEEVRRELAGG